MDIYDKDAASLLAEHDVLLVQEGPRYYLDHASVRKLEEYLGSLRCQVERMKEVVLVVGADEPELRFSVKELRAAKASLQRRAGFLYAETRAAHASGVPKAGTSFDRQEVAGLGVALTLLDAALSKALRDHARAPGGTALGDTQDDER